MAVAEATSRRVITYKSLDDLLTDVHRLASGEVTCVGNWSFGQILSHLAIAFNGSIDGLELHVPWFIKLIPAGLLKKRFLERPLPAGFKFNEKDRPLVEPSADTTTEAGQAALEAAIDRLRRETQRAKHPVLGTLTNDEWTKFHLRHAELHMSFVRAV